MTKKPKKLTIKDDNDFLKRDIKRLQSRGMGSRGMGLDTSFLEFLESLIDPIIVHRGFIRKKRK